MAAQLGELLTTPAIVSGTEGGEIGQVFDQPSKNDGAQAGLSFPLLTALASSGENPIPHYSLACYDDVNVRHYWVDTSVSLDNAPNGFTYVESTLVVTGKF
jgi:hypothetical protein